MVQAVGIANQNNYGQNEMDYSFRAGFGAGLVASLQVAPKGELQMEVLYQNWGQDYSDSFKGRHFEKQIRYALLSIPLLYKVQFTEPPSGYAGVGSELKPHWYILGGIQADRIMSPEIQWRLDGGTTEFLPFVLEGGNPNQDVLEAMGEPSSDADLFTQWDAMLIAAGGFELYTNAQLSFTVELRGGIGLTDMNAEVYRLDNNRGVYAASRNAFLGLHLGGAWRFTKPD